MKLHAILCDYLDSRDVSRGYANNLRRTLGYFCEMLGRSPEVNDLTKHNFALFSDHLREVGKVATTVNTKLRHLKAIWSHANDEFNGPPLPGKLKRLKETPPVVDGWNAAQVGRLLGVIDNQRLRAAVWLAWNTGFRLGDIISLQWHQITPEGLLTIVQSKTQKLIRRSLWRQTMTAIRDIRTGPRVFPPTSKNWLRKQLYDACRLAKISRGAFKYLRRGSASEAEKISPGAGSKHCGHSDPRVFERYYAVQEICGESSVQPPKPVW